MHARVISRQRLRVRGCKPRLWCREGLQPQGRYVCSNVPCGRTWCMLACQSRTTTSESCRHPRRSRPAGGGGGAPGGARPPAPAACDRGSAPGHPQLLGCGRAGATEAGSDHSDGACGLSQAGTPHQRSPILLQAAGVLLALECRSWRPSAASVCPSMETLLGGVQQRRERAGSQRAGRITA